VVLPTAKQLRTTLKRSCPIKPVRACASTLGLISVLLVVLQLIDALGDEEIEQTLTIEGSTPLWIVRGARTGECLVDRIEHSVFHKVAKDTLKAGSGSRQSGPRGRR